MTCPECSMAAKSEHWGFAASCKGCSARALGRTFLAKEERGRRFRLACEHFELTEQQVRDAHAADFMAKAKEKT